MSKLDGWGVVFGAESKNPVLQYIAVLSHAVGLIFGISLSRSTTLPSSPPPPPLRSYHHRPGLKPALRFNNSLTAA